MQNWESKHVYVKYADQLQSTGYFWLTFSLMQYDDKLFNVSALLSQAMSETIFHLLYSGLFSGSAIL